MKQECIKAGGCLGNPCLICNGTKPIRVVTEEELNHEEHYSY